MSNDNAKNDSKPHVDSTAAIRKNIAVAQDHLGLVSLYGEHQELCEIAATYAALAQAQATSALVEQVRVVNLLWFTSSVFPSAADVILKADPEYYQTPHWDKSFGELLGGVRSELRELFMRVLFPEGGSDSVGSE
ncbi:MAG: hypothetical protein ACK5LO_03710 [Leucobacter sp.]